MKNLIFILATMVTFSSYSQWNTVTGSGNIKKETRSVSDFTGIALSGNINVELSYGTSNTITLEGDDNLLPLIETVVEGENLVVKTKDKTGIKTNKKIRVSVSVARLTNLKVSGSGNITGNGDFSNSGTTDISVSGSGNINVGVGSFNETKINISGSGNITLKGQNTNNITAKISGSGDIDCSNFSANDVLAHVSGSGNIKVYANKSIDAKISGSGNIFYKGPAGNINLKSAGSGKIIKV